MQRFVLSIAILLICAAPILAQTTPDPAAIGFTIDRFEISGDNPLSERATNAALMEYLGEHEGLERLQAAPNALEAALREAGYAFIRVALPNQPLRTGTIRLELVPFAIGDITVTGNEHFSADNIRRSVPELAPGTSPNTTRLSRQMATVNLHASKKAEVTFGRSQQPGKVDATIKVKDRAPQRVFAWANNTGSESTGESRLGIGYQHTNVFDRDHSFTFTYTTSPEDVEQVAQYGGYYQIPIYKWGGIVNFFAAYSDVDTGIVADFFDVSGQGTTFGGRYTHLFARRKNYRHWLEFDLTDKKFDNQVDFQGTPLGSDLRSRPASVRYVARWQGQQTSAGFNVGARANIESGSENDAAAYAASRVGADPSWAAMIAGADVSRSIGRWTVTARAKAQYTDEPLISGEQFGVGGIDSVRGFEGREITGDSGYSANLEVWAPPLKKTGLRFVAFVDAGHTEIENALPGEIEKQNILSSGAGVRWGWRDKFSLRLDWGYVLNGGDRSQEGATVDGDSHLHVSLFYTF